jgi:hypothetical protein
MEKSAEFDVTGQYRYCLGREWDSRGPRVGFVMLNPSRADAFVDDPTIRRCIGFARSWGYGSLEVVNLFAYRATKPTDLFEAMDPVGVENDRYLKTLASRVERVVLAWGNWGRIQGRSQIALALFLGTPNLYCFGWTKLGEPCHPLYLKSTAILIPYTMSLTF